MTHCSDDARTCRDRGLWYIVGLFGFVWFSAPQHVGLCGFSGAMRISGRNRVGAGEPHAFRDRSFLTLILADGQEHTRELKCGGGWR